MKDNTPSLMAKAISKRLILKTLVFCLLSVIGGMDSLAIAQVITIVNPVENALVGKTLQICDEISSSFELKNVQAVVEGHVTNLVYSDDAVCRMVGLLAPTLICGPGWEGSISLLGLDRGTKILSVATIDAFGNTAQANRTFIYDQQPELIIDSTPSEFVAHPNLPI